MNIIFNIYPLHPAPDRTALAPSGSMAFWREASSCPRDPRGKQGLQRFVAYSDGTGHARADQRSGRKARKGCLV